jgi:hypothetical protein
MTTIEQFHAELTQEVRSTAENEDSPQSLAQAFTEYAANLLLEAGEANDPRIAVLSKPGLICSGMDWDEERSRLTVFGTLFRSTDGISSLTKADLQPLLTGMSGFTSHSSMNLDQYVDESSDLHDVVSEIKTLWPAVESIRLMVLSNLRLRTEIPAFGDIRDRPVAVEVWDLERIHKIDSSGDPQEPVYIDFPDYGIDGIQALGPFGDPDDYESYLAVIPGDVLARIYSLYGPRLLELNVRSFLQTRGKINQGIQSTIAEEPDRFLAYNNGLSLTAAGIEKATDGKGTLVTSLHDVQIVNGGQTTASLYHALSKSKRDLSDVQVQLKLTVVADEVRHELARSISQFSNAQNPVRMADFTANDKFHVAMEQISRSKWAPGKDGSHKMTRWFFERARGQYADAVARERTPAAQRSFKSEHPISQKILKTDVAKYEHMWLQKPHVVSLGAEKNFREFLQSRTENGDRTLPDEAYFERLVAKAILWKETERIVTKLALGGYRSVTVAYTLAFLSRGSKQRLDLNKIWQEQQLPERLSDVITSLAPRVHDVILQSAGTRNVTEWAKKKECWEAVCDIPWLAPDDILTKSSTPYLGPNNMADTPEAAAAKSDEETEALKRVIMASSHTWKAISSWAKETSNLQAFQRSIAYSLGNLLEKGRAPSVKQALQGVKILDEVERLGFDLKADHSRS